MNPVRGLLFLCLVSLLTSCGQKGSLYLPTPEAKPGTLASSK